MCGRNGESRTPHLPRLQSLTTRNPTPNPQSSACCDTRTSFPNLLPKFRSLCHLNKRATTIRRCSKLRNQAASRGSPTWLLRHQTAMEPPRATTNSRSWRTTSPASQWRRT
ncbi:hypothetical protein IG631_02307 [Alternaria alternata]|nr:hypothetical protein IG631_02307 [Alternaria alternata]